MGACDRYNHQYDSSLQFYFGMSVIIEINNGHRTDGVLYYTENEYSFRFNVASPADLAIQVGAKGTTSLAIGTLQIEVGVETRRALFVWGLHPKIKWLSHRLDLPKSREGYISVDRRCSLQPGVAIEVAPVGKWYTVYDSGTGWIRVAADDEGDNEIIEIAESTLLGARNGCLHSIWLRPILE